MPRKTFVLPGVRPSSPGGGRPYPRGDRRTRGYGVHPWGSTAVPAGMRTGCPGMALFHRVGPSSPGVWPSFYVEGGRSSKDGLHFPDGRRPLPQGCRHSVLIRCRSRAARPPPQGGCTPSLQVRYRHRRHRRGHLRGGSRLRSRRSHEARSQGLEAAAPEARAVRDAGRIPPSPTPARPPLRLRPVGDRPGRSLPGRRMISPSRPIRAPRVGYRLIEKQGSHPLAA